MKITVCKDDGTVIKIYDLTDEMKRHKEECLRRQELMDSPNVFGTEKIAKIIVCDALESIKNRLKIWRDGL